MSSPYELERARDRLSQRMMEAKGPSGLKIAEALLAVSDAMHTILQHLADVEVDRNIERSHDHG